MKYEDSLVIGLPVPIWAKDPLRNKKNASGLIMPLEQAHQYRLHDED